MTWCYKVLCTTFYITLFPVNVYNNMLLRQTAHNQRNSTFHTTKHQYFSGLSSVTRTSDFWGLQIESFKLQDFPRYQWILQIREKKSKFAWKYRPIQTHTQSGGMDWALSDTSADTEMLSDLSTTEKHVLIQVLILKSYAIIYHMMIC